MITHEERLAESDDNQLSCKLLAYLRFIGDRSIDEKDFGTVQKDRLRELEGWSDVLASTMKNKLSYAIVAANNHYAGFGPATANS